MVLKKVKIDKKAYQVQFEFYQKYPQATAIYSIDPSTLEMIFDHYINMCDMIEKKVIDHEDDIS
jgi:hypothetical protein